MHADRAAGEDDVHADRAAGEDHAHADRAEGEDHVRDDHESAERSLTSGREWRNMTQPVESNAISPRRSRLARASHSCAELLPRRPDTNAASLTKLLSRQTLDYQVVVGISTFPSVTCRRWNSIDKALVRTMTVCIAKHSLMNGLREIH